MASSSTDSLLGDHHADLLPSNKSDFAPAATPIMSSNTKNHPRFARISARLRSCLPSALTSGPWTSRALLLVSVVAQAVPLIIITLIFVAGTWLSYALTHKHHLTTSDWDRLYQLVGRKVLAPRNWFFFSLVLAFALVELGMMVWSQVRKGNHRPLTRAFYRLYVCVHVVGSILNLLMLAYIIDGGVRVIHEHIMGPENFLKSWL